MTYNSPASPGTPTICPAVCMPSKPVIAAPRLSIGTCAAGSVLQGSNAPALPPPLPPPPAAPPAPALPPTSPPAAEPAVPAPAPPLAALPALAPPLPLVALPAVAAPDCPLLPPVLAPELPALPSLKSRLPLSEQLAATPKAVRHNVADQRRCIEVMGISVGCLHKGDSRS